MTHCYSEFHMSLFFT